MRTAKQIIEDTIYKMNAPDNDGTVKVRYDDILKAINEARIEIIEEVRKILREEISDILTLINQIK